mmetsp:Transcript_6266/g.16144  ORF Transcript_6266/g.16144 Transcript_6266/m.16144 type:complete len:335 (-) Transcript_6266:436-1440(-)
MALALSPAAATAAQTRCSSAAAATPAPCARSQPTSPPSAARLPSFWRRPPRSTGPPATGSFSPVPPLPTSRAPLEGSLPVSATRLGEKLPSRRVSAAAASPPRLPRTSPQPSAASPGARALRGCCAPGRRSCCAAPTRRHRNGPWRRPPRRKGAGWRWSASAPPTSPLARPAPPPRGPASPPCRGFAPCRAAAAAPPGQAPPQTCPAPPRPVRLRTLRAPGRPCGRARRAPPSLHRRGPSRHRRPAGARRAARCRKLSLGLSWAAIGRRTRTGGRARWRRSRRAGRPPRRSISAPRGAARGARAAVRRAWLRTWRWLRWSRPRCRRSWSALSRR